MKIIFLALCVFLSNFASAQSQALHDLQILSSEKMQGRAVGSEGSALAREYILSRLTELNLKPCGTSYFQEFRFKDKSGNAAIGRNVIACQPGEEKNDNYLVISAHYDHLGNRNGTIYFGADDNASGVAGVLAIAQKMQEKKPRNNVAFVFFDSEEYQLLGANAFIKKAIVPLDKIIINLNFDMIARGDKNELYISGTHQTKSLKPVLQNLNGIGGIKLLFGHDRPEQGTDDWTTQSDQYAFFNAGIPHLYFGVEDHEDYHKPSDTLDKINPHFFNSVIEIIQKTAELVDDAALKTDLRAERKSYR